jgi:hypothetical protein
VPVACCLARLTRFGQVHVERSFCSSASICTGLTRASVLRGTRERVGPRADTLAANDRVEAEARIDERRPILRRLNGSVDPGSRPTSASGSMKPISTPRPVRLTSGEPCCSYSPLRPLVPRTAISLSGTGGGFRSRLANGPLAVFPMALESPPVPSFCFVDRFRRLRFGARPRRLGSGAGRNSLRAARPRSSGRLTTRGASRRTSTHTGAGIGATVPSIERLIADRRLNAVEAAPDGEGPAYR